jgi:hypothetical protein
MNLSFNGAPSFLFLIPVISWLVTLYLILRFLRAFERGVRSHERIAEALSSSVPANGR